MKKDYKRKLVNGMKKATIYGHELYKNLLEKNKSLSSTEKNIIKWEKTPYYNYQKVF